MASSSSSNTSNSSESSKTIAASTLDPQQLPLVRLFKPKVIVLGFHGTISPSNWEDLCIEPYVRKNLVRYLDENWHQPDVESLINKLKDESFDQHFIFDSDEIPLITAFQINYENWRQVIDSVRDYVIWQMDHSKITKNSLTLIKFCWEEGYRQRQINTIIFDDVRPTFLKWQSMDILLGIWSHNMNETVCRLVLSSTTAGNISEFFNYYLNTDINGYRNEHDFYDRLSKYLTVDKKDILIISDYGQDVKMACEKGLQGLVMLRAGNRTPRSYYLIRFPSTSNLECIEFV